MTTATTDTATPPPPAATTTIDSTSESAVLELKRVGNDHFVKNEFDLAIAKYDEALVLDEKNGVILANRSAAKLKLGQSADALVDAIKALDIDPTWKKARHRKAQAEMELDLHWKARRTYEDGLAVEPKDKWIIQQLENMALDCMRRDATEEVTSSNHWREIFMHIPNFPVRLATMATLWNLSAPNERLVLFRRFLEIISDGAETGEEYESSGLFDFPMENYEGIKVPATWVTFYSAQTQEEKLNVFAQMFMDVSDEERDLIIKDMRHLFHKDGDHSQSGGQCCGVDEEGEEGEHHGHSHSG